MLEILVSLAIFSGLVLTVAEVARNVVNPRHDTDQSNVEQVIHVLERDPREALKRFDLRRIEQRTFPNGDRWVTYRYRPGPGSDPRRVSVLHPRENDSS